MDSITPEQRSQIMGRVKNKNSRPEMIIRRLTHGLGYRYRLHRGNLPGRPDLVFPSRKKVIFVHGCFWHQHPSPDCKLARRPKSRLDFWNSKLDGNRERDAKQIKQLAALGWEALIIWECETKDMEALRFRIREFLG